MEDRSPVLATPEQRAAEACLLRLLDDPAVTAAIAMQQERLADIELARSGDGAARLPHAIRTWTGGLIMRWLSGDPAKPVILLSTDNTPRDWCGRSIPATGAAGDNPDHIYRGAFIDGGGTHVIRGRIDPDRKPVQFSVEIVRGLPGKLAVSAAASGTKVRNQIDLITDDQIAFGADGTFELRLDMAGGSSTNHLRTIDEPLCLIIRDVVSDWSQRPARLAIERLDDPVVVPMAQDDMRDAVLADLPGYLDFWTAFPLRWMGGIQLNGIARPVPRDGGWGYQAGLRFSLSPDEATVVRMKQGTARYLGIQVCDPWFLSGDARHHVTSLNNAQALADPDGAFTFVIAPRDPGAVNWLDTGGLGDGMAVLRWQAVQPGEPVDALLLDVRRVDRSALDRDYPGLPRLSADARSLQRSRHAADYALRFL